MLERGGLGSCALAIVLGLATVGCNPARATDGGEIAPGSESQPVAVLVHVLGEGSIASTLAATSTIEAERQVTVHAETTGQVVAFTAEEGDHVLAGRTLGRIEAEAQSAGLDRAHTNFEKAKRDLETIEQLFAQGVASRQELDAARLTFQSFDLDVKDRRRDVGNTKLIAPIGGTITERQIVSGAFVTAGQPLLTITDFDTLIARIHIPERELDRVSVGQNARVVGRVAQGRRGEAVVQRIAPIVDPATGTVKVTVALPDQSITFLPGMYVEVTLTTELHEGALLVPKRALVRDDERVWVFVAEGDRAKRRSVELGLQDGEWCEVGTGLRAGEEVIVAGQAGLKDDAVIRRVSAHGTGSPGEAVESAPEGL